MDFFMSGSVIAASGFVERCKPSRIEPRRSWSAARGSALPSSRQPRRHSDQRSQCCALPAVSCLRSTPNALPSFGADPHCCVSAVQSASHKAGITVQWSASAFGPMRHNLAVVRDAPRAGFVQRRRYSWRIIGLAARHSARPTPPR
jgi:hypothetical protein